MDNVLTNELRARKIFLGGNIPRKFQPLESNESKQLSQKIEQFF